MLPILRLLLVIGAAFQMFSDLVALIANPSPIDAGMKTVVLTIALLMTLVWDLGAIVTMFIVAPAGPAYTERRRRISVYMATLMALLTGAALFLVLVPLGIPYLPLVILLELWFLVIWVGDLVTSVYILR